MTIKGDVVEGAVVGCGPPKRNSRDNHMISFFLGIWRDLSPYSAYIYIYIYIYILKNKPRFRKVTSRKQEKLKKGQAGRGTLRQQA